MHHDLIAIGRLLRKMCIRDRLYGDAGTGKSSTVKAICNEFAAEGLRLVEVKKNQLYQICLLYTSRCV